MKIKLLYSNTFQIICYEIVIQDWCFKIGVVDLEARKRLISV